jgi:hypothetical protein
MKVKSLVILIFLLELKYQRMLVEQSFTNKEPKTIVITCSMPQQKVEITFYLNRPLKLIELTNGEKTFGA